MSRPTRDYVCAALGVAIGVSCFAINNHVTKEWMDPLVAACTGGEYASHQERMLQQDIVPYEPLMGGGFVCIITQFLQALTKHYPGGMLTWSGVLLVSFPFGVVAGVESGRAGSKGPIRYHVAVGLLAQLLGVCLVIPALWIPSYIFGGSRDGAYHPERPWHAVYTFAIPTLLTALIFALDSSSFAWRQCAGVLGGPLLAFLPVVYNYLSPTPTNVKEMQQNQKKAQESYVNALKLVGVLSFVIYICLVYIAVSAYGFHMVAIMNGLWQNAHPAVQFMTVDTTGFFLATLIYVYLQSPRQMLIMAMLVPLLGPGAAFSYIMVQKEPNYVVPKEDTKKQ